MIKPSLGKNEVSLRESLFNLCISIYWIITRRSLKFILIIQPSISFFSYYSTLTSITFFEFSLLERWQAYVTIRHNARAVFIQFVKRYTHSMIHKCYSESANYQVNFSF